MSSPEPRVLRADARRNRERIVDAARQLFTVEGPDAQMDDVARLAGVGVGTVYRHFPNKSALLGELMASKFRNHAVVARRWAQEPDGWTAFEGFLRETFAAMTTDVTLQQRMSWPADGAAVAHAEEARQALAEIVDGMIRRAQRQGTMRKSFTVADMPALMCAVGAVMSAQSPLVPSAEPFIEVVIDGLRTRPLKRRAKPSA